jgi:hypothetical protein
MISLVTLKSIDIVCNKWTSIPVSYVKSPETHLENMYRPDPIVVSYVSTLVNFNLNFSNEPLTLDN